MSSFFKNFGLFLSGLLASFLVLSPTYRTQLMEFVDKDSREVLGTLNLKTSSDLFKVVKVRKSAHIFIEIFKVKPEGGFTLFASFEIPESRDVFYDFQASMTNLFSVNIDDDDGEEVIVPVLDKDLVAHLSVIKFDPKTQSFEHYAF